MKKCMLLLAALATVNCVIAQITDKRTWNWYFGSTAAIQFTSQGQPPVPVMGSAMNATEGSSAISDSAGNLLFYTNGQTAWASNNIAMPNGSGLKGHFWSAQSGLLVPMPGSNTLYYLFTVNNWSDAATELNYSVIDRTLNGGFGDITSQKNILVNSNCREQLTAAYHSNGQDIWIISHEFGTNYVAYLLTAQGLNMTPVVSPVGAVNDGWNRYGYLKVSPYCNKIASALGGQGFILQDTTVQVCDFNNTTGIISHPVFLADYTGIAAAYGCEFSPDNTKLYVTEFNGTNIFQFDLSAANPSSTMLNIATAIGVKSSLTLGPNGKIYAAKQSSAEIGAIDFPNVAGMGCVYTDAAVLLTTGINTIGSCNVFRTCASTTSIMTINNSQNIFDVFPNPASSMLTVRSSEQINQVKISDVTGRIVFETEASSIDKMMNVQIDVSNFSSGIYFLCMDAGEKVFLKKVMVE